MTSAFAAFTAKPLELRHHGTVYRIPHVGIEAGLRIELLRETEQLVSRPELARLLLGSAYDRMIADDVPALFLERARLTASAEHWEGRAQAAEVWLRGTPPEQPQEAQGAPEAGEGLAALDEYGRGERDPLTGLYDWYDLPPEVAEAKGRPISWAAIVDVWHLVEYAFHAELNVDLREVWEVKTWRWFLARLRGLLSTETVLSAHFADDATDPPAGPAPDA